MLKKLYEKTIIVPAVSAAAALITLIVSLATARMKTECTYTYEQGQIISHSWKNIFEAVVFVLLAAILIFSAVNFAVLIASKVADRKKIGARMTFTIIAALFSAVILLFCDILVVGFWRDTDYDPECFEFTDGRHTIIIEERSWLLSGSTRIFQLTDGNNAVFLDSFSTDDGMRNLGYYEIKWADDSAEITYDTFIGENSKETVTLQFE